MLLLPLVLELCDGPVSRLSDTALLKERVAKDKQRLCRMVHLGHRQNKREISPTKTGKGEREKLPFHLGLLWPNRVFSC